MAVIDSAHRQRWNGHGAPGSDSTFSIAIPSVVAIAGTEPGFGLNHDGGRLVVDSVKLGPAL